MDQNVNGLTPAETERLALLMEEAGEVIQLAGKILRHGYNSFHPDDPTRRSNRKLLEAEVGDLQAAIHLMAVKGDLQAGAVFDHQVDKLKRVTNYLHHQ